MAPNKYPPTIFIVGTQRDVGKTVTCMGVIAKLLSPDHGYKVEEIGYMKPVGQQTLTVLDGRGVPIQADKDAVVLTALMGINSVGYDKTSPVIWVGGLTSDFIDQRAKNDPWAGRMAFMQNILESYEAVSEGKRICIVEGTGQPGVGSVAGISNADVINMLREAGVPVFTVLVTRGGIGATIDELWPYIMALDHMGTRIDGIIINGVLLDKVDKINHYLSTYYNDLFMPLYGTRLVNMPVPPILGYVPVIPELGLPTMRLIAEHFATDRHSGLDIVSRDTFDENSIQLVKDLKVVNLRYGYERFVEPGDAVVAGINANDSLMSVVMHHERLRDSQGKGLSGLILSCKSVGGLSRQVHQELVNISNLATMAVDFDTAEIIEQVSNMSVKIQPYDVVKRDRIQDVYRAHLKLWPGF